MLETAVGSNHDPTPKTPFLRAAGASTQQIYAGGGGGGGESGGGGGGGGGGGELSMPCPDRLPCPCATAVVDTANEGRLIGATMDLHAPNGCATMTAWSSKTADDVVNEPRLADWLIAESQRGTGAKHGSKCLRRILKR